MRKIYFMIFVLLLYVFVCMRFLYIKKIGMLKCNKKYKLNLYKNKLFLYKNNLVFKFLLKEKLNQKQLKIVDDILLKLCINAPKTVELQDIYNKEIFLHNYDKKLIEIAKKYYEFADFNINNLNQDTINEYMSKNLNYEIKQQLNLPKQKLSFMGEYKLTEFDFDRYKLKIYKNSKLEIAHYDFGDVDYISIIPFCKTVLNFVFYNPLVEFQNTLAYFEQAQNSIKIQSKQTTKVFGFSKQPNFIHYSKNSNKFSKRNCLILSFSLNLNKSVCLEFYYSAKEKQFESLESLLQKTKKIVWA